LAALLKLRPYIQFKRCVKGFGCGKPVRLLIQQEKEQMHYALKVALYVLTCAGAFFFAWREMKLRNELTEGFSTHKGWRSGKC
jgi:hypothetical protein